MSYFKPLNSNENNLHMIRVNIKADGTLNSPTSNQLPPSFNIDNSDIPNITIDYSDIFTSGTIPSIFITLEGSTASANIASIDSTSCTFNNDSKNSEILIIGPKASGPVYAISNRGWKLSTNLDNENLIYSDMKVGIMNDNTVFNLDINGTVGIIKNYMTSNAINDTNMLNSYYNIIQLINDVSISLLPPIRDGQLLNIIIGDNDSSNLNNRLILLRGAGTNVLNTVSNIATQSGNIVLQSVGDSISLIGYNNKWIVINTYIQNISYVETIPKIKYNIILASAYNSDVINSLKTFINGNISLLNLDQDMTINLESNINNDGATIEIIISHNGDSDFNSFNYKAIINKKYIIYNYMTSIESLILTNISDRIKLLGVGTKWLVLEYTRY
uniref:Uncharacterized protein n=1 Tax=viral metagenome TaxID=1070528 RepID=A0A6C0H1F4_9ZZZZ